MHGRGKSEWLAQRLVVAALLALVLIGILAARASANSGAVILDNGYLNRPAGIASSGSDLVIGATAEHQRSGLGDFLIASLDGSGRLQPGFLVNGLAGRRLDLGGDEEAEDLAVDGARRIIQVGCSHLDGGSKIAVVRYLPDGQLDPTWGSGGKLLLPVSSSSCASAVAVEPDGRVLLAGQLQHLEDEGGTVGFIARFLPDGQLDPQFGWHEIKTSGSNVSIADLLLQPDGKILAVGQSNLGVPYYGFLVRLLADGQLDPDFGQRGLLQLGDPWTALYAVGLRGSEVVASGSVGRGHSQALLMRIPTGGAPLSTTYPLLSRVTGSAGFKRLAARQHLDRRQQGKLRQLLRAGDDSFTATISGGNAVLAPSRGYAISAINGQGQIDQSFGEPLTPGLGWLLPGRNSYLSLAGRLDDLTVDQLGRIVGLGDASFGSLAVARWSAGGRIDRSFGLPSLHQRQARAQLLEAGDRVQLRVGSEAIGARAQLTTTLLRHSCRYVNFPPGASAPDGTYCQWRVVGKPRRKTITLARQQDLAVGRVSADQRVAVGLQLPAQPRAYGRLIGTQLKALISNRGVRVCHQGGRYACGATG